MGRPPAARDLGTDSKTSEWPKTTIPCPPGFRSLLAAVGMLEDRPAWRILQDALNAYVAAMPKADRDAVKALADRAKAKKEN